SAARSGQGDPRAAGRRRRRSGGSHRGGLAMTWNMDDPRWTAYVLGEITGDERDELDRVLESDAEARAYVASLREAVGAIERELHAQAPRPLDDLQRQRIQRAAAPRPRRRWWIAGVTAAAATAGMVLVLGERMALYRQDEPAAVATRAEALAGPA